MCFKDLMQNVLYEDLLGNVIEFCGTIPCGEYGTPDIALFRMVRNYEGFVFSLPCRPCIFLTENDIKLLKEVENGDCSRW